MTLLNKRICKLIVNNVSSSFPIAQNNDFVRDNFIDLTTKGPTYYLVYMVLQEQLVEILLQ